MMAWWADRCDELRRGGLVMPLRVMIYLRTINVRQLGSAMTVGSISFGAQIDRGPQAAFPPILVSVSSPAFQTIRSPITMTKIAKRTGHEAQRSRNCGDPIAAWATASCRRKPAG